MKKLEINNRWLLKLAIIALWLCTGASSLTDPTRPPDYVPSKSQSMKITGPMTLTAIFSYSDYKVAIINGERLRVGDKVGDYTIIKIKANGVELIGPNDKVEMLSLLPTVKQEVSKNGS